MKKHKCTIRPVYNTSHTSIEGRYFDVARKQTVFLTQTGVKRIGELKDGENPFAHSFPPNSELTFEWDPDNKQDAGSVKREFFLLHNGMFCDGVENPNLMGSPIYQFIDELSINEDDYDRINQVHQGISLYHELGWEDQKNVVFSFGGNPIKMTKREMFLYLFDIVIGKLMFRDREREINNMGKFIEMFGDEIKREESEITAMCHKARSFNIIEEKSGVFYLNSESIATSFDGLLSYMKGNRHRYENSVRAVVKMQDQYQEPKDLDSLPTENTGKKDKRTVGKIWTVPEYSEVLDKLDVARTEKGPGSKEKRIALADEKKDAEAFFVSEGIDIKAELEKLHQTA